MKARRGDGTLGELVPGADPLIVAGSVVARGQVATVEIGVEVKILSKAMGKQMGRVTSDIRDQVGNFRRKRDQPICVAIVGINQAERYVSFEGVAEWPTTGKDGHRHPYQEAASVEAFIHQEFDSFVDDLLIMRFKATNYPPFVFEWLDGSGTAQDYGATLTRMARDYDSRFGGRGDAGAQGTPPD